MPYDAKDPRANLKSGSGGESKTPSDFAGADYIKFYEIDPGETSPGARTWYARGQNLIIAYTEASVNAVLSRIGQPDEYIVLLPDPSISAEITTGGGVKRVVGHTISIIPPGESDVRIVAEGRLIRLFTVRSEDLAGKCSNAVSFTTPHANVAPFEPWPPPTKGHHLRTYSLEVPPQEGRFGRIWRCSTIMVNYLDPQKGPREATKMSPHSHDDFEQYSLALEGVFVHHIRWPWITDMNRWRADAHEECATPSVAVIPPPAIHTTQAIGKDVNRLADIFCPPRFDFSQKPGWVLNSDEYPMP